MCTFHGLSFAPGSLNEPRSKLFAEPSSAVWSDAAVTTGGRFFTTTAVVYSLKPPSLSMIRPLTVYVPLSTNAHCADALVPAVPYVEPERSPFVQLKA